MSEENKTVTGENEAPGGESEAAKKVTERFEAGLKKIKKPDKKKLADIGGTIFQVVLVAFVIFSALMFLQDKLEASNSGSGDEDVTVVGSDDEDEEEEDATGTYSIKVNKKKNAVIVYQKNDDGDNVAVKVMRASVGEDTPTGKFEIMESYTWISATDVYWNKYSCRFTENFWFQSADYFAPYNSYISVDSYNAIGETLEDSGCVKLTVEDAKWIYDNCPEGTKVTVVKGKESDELPLEFDAFIELPSYGGWDPTDPDSDNPWRNAAAGTIAASSETIYIERGSNVNHLSNVVALDDDGSNVTKQLEHEKVDSSEVGTYTIKYSFVTSSGKTVTAEVTYEVGDSIGPTISFDYQEPDDDDDEDEDEEEGSYDYTISVSEKRSEKLNEEEYLEKIIKKMKKLVEVNDLDDEIPSSRVVVTLPDELKLGFNQIKYSVEDDYGNTSYLTVTVRIKLKDGDEEKTEEETEEETKKETTTKKQTETTTKKSRQTTTKQTETTTKRQRQTTFANQTTKAAETEEETQEESGEDSLSEESETEQSAGE